MKRSQNYRHLFNPSNGFFQAKTSDGSWLTPFDPLRYGANGGYPYTEGNAWQWSWYVPHDIDGLIALQGGAKKFCERLDRFFSLEDRSGEKNDNASGFIGQYAIGTPLFDRVTIHLAKDKKFEIVTHRKNPADFYIRSMKLNGKAYKRYVLQHDDIVNGGRLDVYM